MAMRGASAVLLLACGLADALLQREAQSEQAANIFNELRESAQEAVDMMRNELPKLDDTPSARDALKSFVQVGEGIDDADKERLFKAVKIFKQRAESSGGDGTAEHLLHHARAAFVETGAVEHLRATAVAAMNATRRFGKHFVPLDSMVMGLSFSLAPWNNLFKSYGLPLVKANFHTFLNFFGPHGDGFRICVQVRSQIDSRYMEHWANEFGGHRLFIGTAKWDNIPGWSFGTIGGFNDLKTWDVADFGWAWTFAREPDTVGFHWEVPMLDRMELLEENPDLRLLQTESHVERTSIPTHWGTWFGHTWCDPDFELAPMELGPTVKPWGSDAKKKDTAADDTWNPEVEVA